MTVNKLILVALSFCAATLSFAAQREYATEELRDIGELLSQHPISHIEHIDSQTGVVTHLGLPIFFKRAHGSDSLIFRFIERFTLYAKLLPAADRKLLLSDNKVKMDVSKVAALDSTTTFAISADENTFVVTLPNTEVSFPKNFQLITGMNKKESEQFFNSQLMDYCKSHQVQTSGRIPLAVPVDSVSYLVEQGDYYIIREINSNRYYLKTSADKKFPIYGDTYASESVANLFQQLVNADFNIDVSQNLYNYQRVQYSLPLTTFIDYCKSEGCRTFVGIEEETDDKVKAAVVFRNDAFAYNHLLYIEVDRKVLREQKGEISGILYCYIPTHNLKNLFVDEKK